MEKNLSLTKMKLESLPNNNIVNGTMFPHIGLRISFTNNISKENLVLYNKKKEVKNNYWKSSFFYNWWDFFARKIVK